jgi:hypothetical protein
VKRCRPSPAHQRIATVIHALLTMISISVMQSLVWAQSSSSQPKTPPPFSIAVHEGSPDSQFTSTEYGPSGQELTSPCSLRVPDTIRQPSVAGLEGEGATPKQVHLVYTPLPPRCKFRLFLTSVYSPYTFASAGFQATEAQATSQWPHYGGGMQGWGKRLGATLLNTESRRFIQEFALSTILHQDPRYFSSPKRGFFPRVWYSASRVLITRNDHGNSTFNTSEFLGVLFTSALQNGYYPRHDRTFGETMNRFSGALSSDVIGDLLREFTPDMKRFVRRHAPKRILKLEDKLPIPAEDKP